MPMDSEAMLKAATFKSENLRQPPRQDKLNSLAH